MIDSKDIASIEELIIRLRTRASIRRSDTTRKSVQEGKPDRMANLLDEAATALQVVLVREKANE